jgi:hypothetical protein
MVALESHKVDSGITLWLLYDWIISPKAQP